MPRKFTRKEFLKISSLATTALLIPGFLKTFAADSKIVSSGSRKLLVIQLSGGNDGLNTVIPVRNDIYYKNRPGIAIKSKSTIGLNDELGLNSVMKDFMKFYDNGNLTILNGVGYPNPNKSHFRSMEIWQSASDSDEYKNTGWLGRYLDSECTGCQQPSHAIEVDELLSLSLKGENHSGMAIRDPKRLFLSTSGEFIKEISKKGNSKNANENADFLYKTLIDATSSVKYIYSKSRIYKSSNEYPDTPFGKNLKTISELIISGIETKVFYISLSGFDTHANQNNRQDKLLQELSEGLSAFMDDMKKNGSDKEILSMVFSEFGRRVVQNGSGGTDHGTANNLFLIGGGISKPGIYNDFPDLSQLDNGDINFSIDFRKIYSTILKKWMNVNDVKILDKDFGYYDFI
jgi:uncharacterized protein (DUF1501 family)